MSRDVITPLSGTVCGPSPGTSYDQPVHKQVALLWQRDRVRHLSVEILQLQNISLENVILRLAVFIQYRTVTDTHTHKVHADGQTHDDGIYRTWHSVAR